MSSPILEPQRFWAKLGVDSSDEWHPLIAHSADVAAVGERLLQPDSTIARRLAHLLGRSQVPESLRGLLILMLGMHDLGKTNHGFSDRRHGGGSNRFDREGHVQVVLQSLGHRPFVAAVEKVFEDVTAPDADLVPIFAASIAHHGRPFSPAQNRGGLEPLWSADLVSGRDPLAEVRRLGHHLRRWSGVDDYEPIPELPSDPRFTHIFAGLVTLSDWIGSTVSAFEFAPWADDDPDRYWETEARPRADRACREIGVVASRVVVVQNGLELYRRVFPDVFGGDAVNQPTELQARVATIPLPPAGSRVLIEGATGSGKTEAAIALFARLRASGDVGGLMFALPTRATARAMHDRVAAALDGVYGSDVPGITLAVGGTAPQIVSSDAVSGGQEHLYDEDDGSDGESLATWASSHGKKFLAAEIVIGTIDQVLLAALAVKHAHLRLAGLCRHLLVIDEVHSHDRYMLQVLRTLLEFHSNAGGHVVLMSATLSAGARARLRGSEPPEDPLSEDVERPYPTLAIAKPGEMWSDHGVDIGAESRSVVWQLCEIEQGFEEAIEAARAGARVCILRNLVKDAQETVRGIREGGNGHLLWCPPGSTDTPPYHAKYTRPDRALLDAAVLARFGKHGPERGGCILVATQVVEQSLDVDFDFLITDLAPIEILLQRIGRLHRHLKRTEIGARPPGFELPKVGVFAPEGPFQPKREYRGPHGWGTVYREQPILELTRRLIAHRPEIVIPSESRLLMEEVYHWTRIESMRNEDGWSPVLDEMEGQGLSESLHASDCVLHFHKHYHDNVSRYRDEARIRTRIGDDTVGIELDPPVACRYATSAIETHVDRRINEVIDAGLNLAEPRIGPGKRREDGVTEYPMGNGTLRYGPSGWVHHRDG